jgi:hypothetical protein
MASKVAPLLELDLHYLAAQAQAGRLRPYATGKLVDSRTLFYRLFTRRYVRAICATDRSERVHESTFIRLDGANGAPDPSPYGNADLRSTLEAKRDQMVPLSEFEKNLLAAVPQTEPEKIIPQSHHRLTFCDKVVMALGGYRP